MNLIRYIKNMGNIIVPLRHLVGVKFDDKIILYLAIIKNQ